MQQQMLKNGSCLLTSNKKISILNTKLTTLYVPLETLYMGVTTNSRTSWTVSAERTTMALADTRTISSHNSSTRYNLSSINSMSTEIFQGTFLYTERAAVFASPSPPPERRVYQY